MQSAVSRSAAVAKPARRALLRLFLAAVTLGALAPGAGHSAAPANGPTSLAGQLLVATEDMPDPRFARTVIYIVRHDATGAQGFIVNRPLREVPMTVLLEKIGIDDKQATGSVRPAHRRAGRRPQRVRPAHARLHERDDLSREGRPRPHVERRRAPVARGTERRPRRSLLALGYAGWGPGQLEKEMQAGGWVPGDRRRGDRLRPPTTRPSGRAPWPAGGSICRASRPAYFLR